MVDKGNIRVAFGPAHGDRTSLSKPCRTTLDVIYQHPLSHNLEWTDVIALFAQLGSVKHTSSNELVFQVGGEHHQLRQGHGKDLAADDVMGLRHMLTRAGWSPGTTRSVSPGAISSKTAARLPDLLVAVDHHEARIYQLDVMAADHASHTIRPYDPHHVLHHLAHKDQAREHGQRAAEDPTFYARICEALRSAGRIVLVGHGNGHSNAAHLLAAYLRQHHKDLFPKLGLEVDVDLSGLTVPQLLDLGRHSLSVQEDRGSQG